MDKFIIVKLNMFSLFNQIFLADETEMKMIGEYTLSELPAVLGPTARENEVTSIRVAGNGTFAEDLIHEFNLLEASQYNENKINIEVIK